MKLNTALIVFAAGVSLAGIGALSNMTDRANIAVAEQAVKQTEQTLKAPQVVRYPEHSVTCFWWKDLKLIDCMPDYQLGTRNKYEG